MVEQSLCDFAGTSPFGSSHHSLQVQLSIDAWMKETFALATTCKHFSQDICEVQVFCHFCMIVSHLMQWTNTVVHPYNVGMDAKFCASSVLRIHLASC